MSSSILFYIFLHLRFICYHKKLKYNRESIFLTAMYDYDKNITIFLNGFSQFLSQFLSINTQWEVEFIDIRMSYILWNK